MSKDYPPLDIKNLSGIKKNTGINPNLPQPPFMLIITGPSRAGKSNLIKNLLIRKDMLGGFFKQKHMFIICPSLKFNDDYDMLTDAQKFDTFNNQIMNDIIQEQTLIIDTYKKKRTPHILIVLDDIADNPQFANSRILQQLAFRGRHMKVSVILSVQKYSAVPRGVRINATNIIMFRPSNYSEIDIIGEEMADKDNRKNFKKMVKDVFKEPYKFIHFDLLNIKLKERIKIGFDEIVPFEWA